MVRGGVVNTIIISFSAALVTAIVAIIIWVSTRRVQPTNKSLADTSPDVQAKQPVQPPVRLPLPSLPSTTEDGVDGTLRSEREFQARQQQRGLVEYDRLKASTNAIEDKQRLVRANKAYAQQKEEAARRRVPPPQPRPPSTMSPRESALVRERQEHVLRQKELKNKSLYENETLLPAPHSESRAFTSTESEDFTGLHTPASFMPFLNTSAEGAAHLDGNVDIDTSAAVASDDNFDELSNALWERMRASAGPRINK